MAHLNEYYFLSDRLRSIDFPVGKILEIGSADYGHGINYRKLFPTKKVIGIDLEQREGVDIVADMTDCDLGQFAGILCCSVLEHSEKPWKIAENIYKHLLPGGVVYISCPWVWRYHGYPKDYFRFSADGIKSLLPQIKWLDIAYSTRAEREFLTEEQTKDWEKMFLSPQDSPERIYIAIQQLHMIGIK